MHKKLSFSNKINSKYQQFTYGVISEGFFCGKFAEILQKIRGKYVASGKSECGNFAELCGQVSAMTPSRAIP